MITIYLKILSNFKSNLESGKNINLDFSFPYDLKILIKYNEYYWNGVYNIVITIINKHQKEK